MNKRHGSPYDRGVADSWYRRGMHPHYYETESLQATRIERDEMTEEEIQEYILGYEENEALGEDFRKEWE